MILKYLIHGTKFTIPRGVEVIGSWAFYDCIDLEEIIIPNSVMTICESAFRRCISLKNITIPDSVDYIGEDIFKDCESLENIVVYSERVKKLICEQNKEVQDKIIVKDIDNDKNFTQTSFFG